MTSVKPAITSFWHRHAALLLGSFAALMLALHWVHLWADPNWKLGFLTESNWAGDFFTDEGWEANGAARTILMGSWHAPGEVNLAVESPLWPLLLYLPFKLFGVKVVVSRAIAVGFYATTVAGVLLFVRRLSNLQDATLTATLLSVNIVGFAFGRVGFVEPEFTCCAVLGMLAALYAAERSSVRLSILCGLLLSLALLFKLTALFSVVPIVAIFWLRAKGVKTRIVLLSAAFSSFAFVQLLHYVFLTARYPIEHQVYLQRNLSDRSVSDFYEWVVAVLRVSAGLHLVGPFLITAFCAGLIASLFQSRKIVKDPLLVYGSIWLIANMAIFSKLYYFPPRYCLSLVFPVTVLAVRFARLTLTNFRAIGIALYALIACALVSDAAQDLYYLAHPEYTMLHLAERVTALLPDENQRSCAMIGYIGNTLSLYNRLQSENYMPGWTTQPQSELIKACNPKIFIARGELKPETRQQFEMAGKTLHLQEQVYALAGEAGPDPVSLYLVQNKK